MTFASFSPLRNLCYEFFKASHFLAALIFVVFFFLHCDFRLSSWDYFIATGVIFSLTFLHSQLRIYFQHGLKKANIPFRIFERDTSSSLRAQGYRIRIGPDGATALKHLLPEDLWQAFEATCADIIHGGNRLDAKTGEITVWQRGPPPSRPTVEQQHGRPAIDDKAYNADRAVLRSVLRRGLEDDIEFGKKFERYDVASDDQVVAYFNDGSGEKGKLLVGADGVRSVVRKQLLPGMHLLDTEGRAVFGKTVLTGQLREKMAPQVGDGIALAAESEESRMKLFTDGMSWNREHASPFARKLDIELPDDYIYWVLVFRKDIVNSELEKSLLMLSNEQSAKLASI